MTMGVTALRRPDQIRKPAVVVADDMLEQFAREWTRPTCRRVLVAGRDDCARTDAATSWPGAPQGTGAAS
jgi:hypothetical protein